jgi:transcriptional regulator with XRE-family HTH domain
MVVPIPGEVLRHVREAQRTSLVVLAKEMGTVASVLSKLERATEAEPEIAERYLTALGTELAKTVQDYYARPWRQERPPSFLHPDAEALWLIDQAHRTLDEFEAENGDPVLRKPIALLRGELNLAEGYLTKRDHTVAWVGDIGVGKTTALSYAVGLLVGDGRSTRKPAFPVGSGRTTVCETAIRVATTFGVLVDPRDDEEVVRLTRDLVTSLTPDAVGGGVSSEEGRVLRSMADMQTSNILVEDEPVSIDPITDLLNDGVSVDEVVDQMVAKMRLHERKERQIILPEGSEDGLAWVSRLVAKINLGQDERFSLPSRITVLMPSPHLSADGQQLQVVDTRGVDSTTQRKDLIDFDDENRTLMVLCSKFADAPTATVQRLLQDAVSAGSGSISGKRKCILVLPRGDEALEMSGYDGLTRPQGYAIRRKEIEQALIKAELPKVPIYFFDARNDDPDKIWASLRDQIGEMRASFRDRAVRAADGARNLRENKDAVRAAEARSEVERDIGVVLDIVQGIGESMRPAHQNLVDQMAIGHHSSIAASVARRGRWEAFNFAQILGQGVRIDANQRTANHVLRIKHKIDELERRWHDTPSVLQTLSGIGQMLADTRQDFLSSARAIGVEAYGTLLEEPTDIWATSARRYGLGPGYKRDVAELWRDWLLSDEDALKTSREVSQRLQHAWTVWVIDPLRAVVASPDP